MTQALTLPLKAHRFRLAYLLQCTVYLAYEYRKMLDPKEGAKKLREELKCLCHREQLYDFQVRFDETLWPPSNPEDYEQLMEINLRPDGSAEFFQVRIDFRKSRHHGVSILSDGAGWFPIDVFHVRFTE